MRHDRKGELEQTRHQQQSKKVITTFQNTFTLKCKCQNQSKVKTNNKQTKNKTTKQTKPLKDNIKFVQQNQILFSHFIGHQYIFVCSFACWVNKLYPYSTHTFINYTFVFFFFNYKHTIYIDNNITLVLRKSKTKNIKKKSIKSIASFCFFFTDYLSFSTFVAVFIYLTPIADN